MICSLVWPVFLLKIVSRRCNDQVNGLDILLLDLIQKLYLLRFCNFESIGIFDVESLSKARFGSHLEDKVKLACKKLVVLNIDGLYAWPGTYALQSAGSTILAPFAGWQPPNTSSIDLTAFKGVIFYYYSNRR